MTSSGPRTNAGMKIRAITGRAPRSRIASRRRAARWPVLVKFTRAMVARMMCRIGMSITHIRLFFKGVRQKIKAGCRWANGGSTLME